jgi:hypothetical protein
MGPEVAKKMGGIRGMASVAGPKEVREMHKVSVQREDDDDDELAGSSFC